MLAILLELYEPMRSKSRSNQLRSFRSIPPKFWTELDTLTIRDPGVDESISIRRAVSVKCPK